MVGGVLDVAVGVDVGCEAVDASGFSHCDTPVVIL